MDFEKPFSPGGLIDRRALWPAIAGAVLVAVGISAQSGLIWGAGIAAAAAAGYWVFLGVSGALLEAMRRIRSWQRVLMSVSLAVWVCTLFPAYAMLRMDLFLTYVTIGLTLGAARLASLWISALEILLEPYKQDPRNTMRDERKDA